MISRLLFSVLMFFLDCFPAYNERFVQKNSITFVIYFFSQMQFYITKINIQIHVTATVPSISVVMFIPRWGGEGVGGGGGIFVSQYYKPFVFF